MDSQSSNRRWIILTVALALVACSSDGDAVKLVAPFNERTVLGEVTAVWKSTGEERGFAAGARLKEPQARLRYRADVRNRLGDKLFIRLGTFQLVDDAGLEIGSDSASVECTLATGASQAVLAGDVWVPKQAVGKVRGFHLEHFAVPLNDRGRALYREWLLQGRPADTAAIDAEIARYAAAPPCPSTD